MGVPKKYLLILIAFTFLYSPLFSQETKESTQIEKEYQFLKEQNAQYLNFLKEEQEKHRTYLMELLKTSSWVVGSAFALVIALFSYLGFQSFREFNRYLQEKLTKIAIQKADEVTTDKFQKVLSQNVDHLQGQINLIRQYQNSRILFLGKKEELVEMETFELNIIQRLGLSNISKQDTVPQEQKLKNHDIIVYAYHPDTDTGEDIKLQKLITKMANVKCPLIVYTKQSSISPNDKKLLDTYKWYLVANMPLTLLGHLYNAANIFYTAKKD